MTVAHALPRVFLFRVEASSDLAAGLGAIDWTSGSTRHYVIGPDVSALVRQHVANENIVERWVQTHREIPTVKSGVELPFACYMHGSPSTAAEGAQSAITNYPLATLLKNALGGLYRGYAVGVAGGTASAPAVDSDTNIGIGDWLAFKDASTGVSHMYQVRAKPGANVLTLDRDLHFTPDAGGADTAHAVIVVYLDGDVVTHHDDADHTLLAVLVAGEHDDDVFEARGVKLALSIAPINPGEPTRVTFAGKVTSQSKVAKPGSFPSTIHGEAGTVPGVSDTYAAFIGDVGSAMAATTLRGTVTPNVGIGYDAVMGAGGTEAVLGYVGTGRTDITVEVEALFDGQWFTDYDDGTEKSLLIEIGDRENSMPWALYYPQLEIMSEPVRVGDQLTGLKIMMRARENEADPGALTGASLRRWRSPIQILVQA